ncbi:MAG: threonine aldolase [Alphaproteobacteria bacterium]|nr:threonine aldolase [Alphaproteobacteria bacterium]
MIDFLSDTVTHPTPEMRRAMAEAPVGDDVYGEDPTVNRLEAMAAERLGKEASCFMPSGTMANLTSVLTHCPRGYEVLLGDESDLYHYEAGGYSVVGGVVVHPIRTRPDGTLALSDIRAAVRDPHDPQCARAGLLCLENPHCRSGGRVLPLSYMGSVRALADELGLPIHLDGARIFNAALALGVEPAVVAGFADSVQFCLSKNLAAPVGSMVVGDAAFVADVRRLRKMLGGGMRQVGIIAAAGVVALETMVDRLADDHARARRLAEAIAEIPGIDLDLDEVQTNMVFFRVDAPGHDGRRFLAALAEQGVRMGELGHGRIRAVVHYQISDADIDVTIEVFKRTLMT